MSKQLRLVTDEQHTGPGAQNGPTERLFAHWLWFMGISPRRAVLGPTRRRAIALALQWGYSEQTLELAIEGCSATPHNMGDNDRAELYNDLTLILRDEAHVERFAKTGEALRTQAAAAREAQLREAKVHPEDTVSDEEAAALRKACRELAMQRSGRAR